MQRHANPDLRLQQEFVPQTFTLADFVSVEVNGIRAFSIMQAENTILVVLAAMMISKWMRRFKDGYVLQTGVVLYTLGYASLGYSNTLWVLVAAMSVATIGELMMTPVSQSYMAEIVKDEARNSYMAVNGLVFQGARLLGAAGITVGALVPSWVMTCVFPAMGLISLRLHRTVLADKRQDGQKTALEAGA
jgi:DHA1 family multidrug resistance protein B-like MFS transporter